MISAFLFWPQRRNQGPANEDLGRWEEGLFTLGISPKCRCPYVHQVSNLPCQAKDPQCIQWNWKGLIDQLGGDSQVIWYNTDI